MKNLGIGSDIEFAAFDLNAKTYTPAGLLGIKGRKGKPDMLKHGGVEVDCCGVEITPKQGYTMEEFVSNIVNLKMEVAEMFPNFRFDTLPSHSFDPKTLQTAPDAMVMGCDPDMNAWTGERNPSPRAVGQSLRTFGGHIHVEGGSAATVVAMDLLLGIWSNSLIPKATDKYGLLLRSPAGLRRELYGKLGAYRVKPYGIEYRVLDNFWAEDEEKMRMVYRLTNYARSLKIPAIKAMLRDFPRVHTGSDTPIESELGYLMKCPQHQHSNQSAYVLNLHQQAFAAGF